MFAAFNNWDQNHCGVTTSLAARPGRVPRALNRRARFATRSRAGAATIQSREAFMIDKATAIKYPKHRSLYLADVE